MSRKIILLMILLTFLPLRTSFAEIVSTAEPFNYENGLLDHNKLIRESEWHSNIFDNNLTSAIGANDFLEPKTIYFNHPVDINGMFYRVLKLYSNTKISLEFIFTGGESYSFDIPYQNIDSGYTNKYISLNFNNIVQITLRSISEGNNNSYNIHEIDFFGEYDDSIIAEIPDSIIPNIENINFTPSDESLNFTFDLPQSENFSHVIIIVNGNEYQTTETNFLLEGLEPATEYEVNFISVDKDGNESPGVTIKAKTLEKVIEEVKEVKVQAKHNRVDLSWQLPEQEDFNHVKIYRKTIEELKEIETSSLIHEIFTNKVYAEEAGEYDPLFETNGTYFNDLTVKPRSEYEYKLTTVTADGQESQGVYVTAQTPEEPDPQIVGGGYTETESGDYLYTWTEPTEGEVKIIVGGEQYATVPASQGEFIIPAEDMEYIFGKPDVSLIPISQYGKEGMEYNPTNPLKNINLPFDASGLLKSGFSLLTIVGPFVLLALSFIFVPRLIRVIKQSAENRKVRGGIR